MATRFVNVDRDTPVLLQLLIYCYANGIFSSRRIERATYRDVAVRFLTANTHPDHDTICTIRREGRENKGREIHPPKDTPDDREQVNLTDHDSRLMRKSKRKCYTQPYNAQAAVDADGSHLILSNHVTTCASDANELEPAVNNIPASVGTPDTVLADTGYANGDGSACQKGEPQVRQTVSVLDRGRPTYRCRVSIPRPRQGADHV